MKINIATCNPFDDVDIERLCNAVATASQINLSEYYEKNKNM